MIVRRRTATALVLAAALISSALVAREQAAPDPVLRRITFKPGVFATALAVDAHAGHAFVSVYDGQRAANSVLMVDTRSGRILRVIRTPNLPTVLAVDERRDRLFVAGDMGTIWFVSTLDARSGALLSTTALNSTFNDMLVDEQDGRLIIASAGEGTMGPNLFELDSATGRLVRILSLAMQPLSLAIRSPGRLIAIQAGSGTTSDSGPLQIGVFDETTGRLLQTAPHQPTCAQESLVFDAQRDGYCIDVRVNPLPWAFLPPRTRGSGTLTSDSGAGATMLILDARSGATLHTIRRSGLAVPPVIDERAGHVFFISTGPATYVTRTVSAHSWTTALVPRGNGHVLMLDEASGHVLRSTTVGAMPDATALDGSRHLLFVLNSGRDDPTQGVDASTISVLDTRTGALLRTIGAGIGATAMGVDARHGRLIVTTNGGPVRPAALWSWMPSWLARRLPFAPHMSARATTVPGSMVVIDESRL